MEATLHNLFSSLPQHKHNHNHKLASIPSHLTTPPQLWRRLGKAVAGNSGRGRVKCGRWEVVERELELELEDEMNFNNIEEWIGMERWRDKCGGKGVVELLECLENEAIMGEDQGRHPNDYNRRAQIFHKSSTVFQALKQHRHTSSTHQSP